MAVTIKAYTIVAYPESLPDNFREKLDILPFGYKYSLHDKDVNPEDGKMKKAHLHFFFLGNPSKKQKEYISASLGVGFFGESVRSLSGMYDYLTHENDPNKYHYDKDIIQTSPKWCQELFEQHYVPKTDPTAEIIDIIESQDIEEYSDLMIEISKLGREDLQKTAQQLWVMRYVDSKRHKFEQKGIKKYD